MQESTREESKGGIALDPFRRSLEDGRWRKRAVGDGWEELRLKSGRARPGAVLMSLGDERGRRLVSAARAQAGARAQPSEVVRNPFRRLAGGACKSQNKRTRKSNIRERRDAARQRDARHGAMPETGVAASRKTLNRDSGPVGSATRVLRPRAHIGSGPGRRLGGITACSGVGQMTHRATVETQAREHQKVNS